MGNKLKTTWENNKEYLLYGSLVVLLILFLWQWDSNRTLTDSNVVLKVAKKQSESRAKMFEQNYDLAQAEILKKDDSLKVKDLKIAQLQKEKAKIKVDLKKRVKIIKTYGKNEFAAYFKERYKDFGKEVSVTETGISLTDSICQPIAIDLESGDAAKKENIILEQELTLTKEKVVIQKEIIVKQEEQKITLTSINEETKGQLQISDQIVKDQEKSLKSERTKNKVAKVAIIVSGIAGIIIGASVK